MEPDNKFVMPMSGFTSDFFNTLAHSDQEGSMDLSRQIRNSEISNRSEFIVQLKEESIAKIECILTIVFMRNAFYEIQIEAVKSYRRSVKTQKNVAKRLLKMALMIDLKQSSRMQISWNRILHFTKKYNMSVDQPHLKKAHAFLSILTAISTKNQTRSLEQSFAVIKSQSQNHQKYLIFCQILKEIVSYHPCAKQFMKALKVHHRQTNNAQFIGQTLQYMSNLRIRVAFTYLKNFSLKPPQEGINQNIGGSQIQPNKEHYSGKNSSSLSVSSKCNEKKEEQNLQVGEALAIPIGFEPFSKIDIRQDAAVKLEASIEKYPTKIGHLLPDRFLNFQETDLIDFCGDMTSVKPTLFERPYASTPKKQIIRGQSNGPLQFSRKNQNSVMKKRSSKIKSETSQVSSVTSQVGAVKANPQTYNIQSMKSYYFPENKQQNKSNKWINESLKQRLILARQYMNQQQQKNKRINQRDRGADQSISKKKEKNIHFKQCKGAQKQSIHRMTSLHRIVDRQSSCGSLTDRSNGKQGIQIKFNPRNYKKSSSKKKEEVLNFKNKGVKGKRKNDKIATEGQIVRQYNINSPSTTQAKISSTNKAGRVITAKSKNKI